MSVRRVTAPALSLAELVDLTQEVADEVRRGCHAVHADTEERWHVRLRRDAQVDVWLISWTTDQGTQLHDHGGSCGAYAVVEGELCETVWAPGARELRDTSRATGDTVVFGEHYVHDVRNVEAVTAVSVHAYSPPLESMNYYEVEHGQLIRLASAWTDDPEATAPASVAARRAS